MNMINLLNRNRPAALAAALLVVLTTGAVAGDDSFERLVAKWKSEREQLLRHMTQQWLQGVKPESMKADLVTLTHLESGLATQPGITLYLSEVDNTQDPKATVGAVIRAYLNHRGAAVNSADFVRGKRFTIIERKPTAQPENAPAQPDNGEKK